jgi:hypothetical protein
LSSHPGPACFILHGGFGFYATVFLLSRSFNAKENALFNLTNILLTIGIFALISGVATMVKAYRRNSRKQAAPFLHYFEPEYDRNLFPLDSWRIDENLYHLQSPATVHEIRHSCAADRYSKGNGATRRD